MSNLQRRDFLTGTAFAAGVTAALAGIRRAEAADPSFINNVPDPLLVGKELPTFKFALEKSPGRVVGKSTVKIAGVAELPICRGIAGASVRLEPGAMRDLHWHPTAAEWGFVDQGRVRTTVIGPRGEAETNDFEPGDVWYFPRGHGHMVACLGDEPSHFVEMLDNGYFPELGAISITDWIAHTPKSLLAKNFGVPEATFDGFPEKEVSFPRGAIPPQKPAAPLGRPKPPPQTHKWRLLAQAPTYNRKGVRMWVVDSQNFPISKTITGSVLELAPGALRELHWHPSADEWQYVLEGKVSVTMFGPGGRSRTETLEKGDVGYIPQGYGHSLENVGDKPCRVLVGFNSGIYESIALSEWIAGNPPDVLATNFGVPAARFEKLAH